MPDREIRVDRSQHIQNAEIYTFDHGPIRKSAIGNQERVGVTDATEQRAGMVMHHPGLVYTFFTAASLEHGSEKDKI